MVLSCDLQKKVRCVKTVSPNSLKWLSFNAVCLYDISERCFSKPISAYNHGRYNCVFICFEVVLRLDCVDHIAFPLYCLVGCSSFSMALHVFSFQYPALIEQELAHLGQAHWDVVGNRVFNYYIMLKNNNKEREKNKKYF